MNARKNLYLIQSTDATIHGFKENGLWERQRSTIERLAKDFQVFYFTSDWINYQDDLPQGVIHKISAIKTKAFGLRHIMFYLFLISSSLSWRRTAGVIRVFGVTIPVLPIIKRISGKKIVISYQYDWAEQTRSNYRNIKHYVSRSIEKSSIDSADFIICTMQWLYDKAINFYHKHPNKCIVIPNYVDLDHFYPEPKQKIIVFAGRLHWSKGVDTLINAFIKFSALNSNYQLLIFGSGDQQEALKKLAAGNEKIIFKGATPINTYAATLRSAEVFVLPTVTMEGHPKALIEAMAAGCKCIASDAPGNIDVMKETETQGNTFKAGDVDALLERLENIESVDSTKTYNFAVNNYSRTILLDKECSVLQNYVS